MCTHSSKRQDFNATGQIVLNSFYTPAGYECFLVHPCAAHGTQLFLYCNQVIFERFWWDRNGEDLPTKTPPATASAVGDEDGSTSGRSLPWGGRVVDRFVQVAGKAMFFDGLSAFPVLYLDDDLCVFQFKAAGTVVASQRVVD